MGIEFVEQPMPASQNAAMKAVKAAPGAYLTLSRTWKDNDTVELRMPFTFRLDHMVDQPNVAGVFYGPVLLAGAEMVRLLKTYRVEINDSSAQFYRRTAAPAAIRPTTSQMAVAMATQRAWRPRLRPRAMTNRAKAPTRTTNSGRKASPFPN